MTGLRPKARTSAASPTLLALYVLSRTGLAAVRVENGAFSEDPVSLAMMLGAVSDFVRDAIHRGRPRYPGVLRVVEGSRGFCVLPKPAFGLIAVHEGPGTEALVDDLGALARRIEKQAGPLLANWDGDLESMASVERTVRDYLETGPYGGGGSQTHGIPQAPLAV